MRAGYLEAPIHFGKNIQAGVQLYSKNNPLRLVDPSGEYIGTD